MEPKPAHLDLKYAEQFKDQSIADMYHYRPPYPEEAINKLLELISDEPRHVLDVGCGTGDLARRLVDAVERVDAVDFSQAMIARGRALPNGDHPHLRWLDGRVEEVELDPPYALITAGESLHWMEWEIVMPLFQRLLTPNGYLALVGRGTTANPWDTQLQLLIARFSTNREYRPYNLIHELERRRLFSLQGHCSTQPVPFVQSSEEYIRSIHSRNGFSLDRMDREAAQTFDVQVSTLLAPFLHDGLLTQFVTAQIVWGKPVQID